jgi:peroxiredoxin
MLPDSSLSFTQKTQLEFPVLSDPGNEYAKQLGLLFQMPEELRDVFEKAGHDLKGKNGDDTFTVPVPGTFLIDGEGRVRNRFVEADYRKRVDAETVLGWVEGLDGERIKR